VDEAFEPYRVIVAPRGAVAAAQLKVLTPATG
jgi:hypothetical protein